MTYPLSRSAVVFRQLFDLESSTYTYLLGDLQTKQALLIDPVLEQTERDAKLLKEMGLELKFALNTHVHADHITGSGLLKQRHFPGMMSVLGKHGNDAAMADVRVGDGESIKMGEVEIEFRSTPGHTNGCHTFVYHKGGMAFTGDAVLVRGCGRCDFQDGSSPGLYASVWNKILSLPEDFLLYPAHDYKGHTVSSVGEEKKFNPRLTKNVEEFTKIMEGLNLPYPKKIDASVPMNKVCGLYELLSEEDKKKIPEPNV